ncbi:MAG TPA: hypothetical protein VFU78_06710, partial [Thermomicrobiales bacterium]|nr:hypothetical protein [Thermomicrobiales bacterium]
RLFGAGEAALEALGSAIWPSNRLDYERAVAGVQAALTAETFATAWAEGRRLALAQAVTLALDQLETPRVALPHQSEAVSRQNDRSRR